MSIDYETRMEPGFDPGPDAEEVDNECDCCGEPTTNDSHCDECLDFAAYDDSLHRVGGYKRRNGCWGEDFGADL